jgi:FtsH-binding integral membrane protein
MELWQAWQRGDRRTVRPWIGLLVSFCLVLAGMYSFFFFSTTALSNDPLGGAIMSFVFIVLVFYLGRRISPEPRLVALVVGFMAAVSLAAFGLWLLACTLSGWNAWVAIMGTLALGLLGAFVAVPSLNAIERQYGRRDE